MGKEREVRTTTGNNADGNSYNSEKDAINSSLKCTTSNTVLRAEVQQ